MIVGILKETFPDEHRVAMVPDVGATLKNKGIELLVETRAGDAAGYPDQAYITRGAEIVANRKTVFERAHVILQVRTPGANPDCGKADLAHIRTGQVLIGGADPFTGHEMNRAVAQRGAVLFAMELIPRITRAQSMDILSSMATVTGYKAVLIAAAEVPRMFPLLMTASGTVRPARVLIIGAGVAGLQAIATSRRLGAVVQAYDVRAAVREQIESLGAQFVDLKLNAEQAEGAGGYAQALSEDFYVRQRQALARVVAENHIVISTAAIPGKPSPLLITEDAVKAMAPGSVIVDLAAERGGNCALTQAGQTVVAHGVKILGPLNLPATVPYHASQMYAQNLANFLGLIAKNGVLTINMDDEIVSETLIARNGGIVHERIKEMMQS